VSLSDLIESRLRKEQELEYYQEALTRLVKKVSILQKEIDITNLIIDMIEGEKVMTIEEKISKMIEVESND
tara:strand:+ start:774 stop:986 length:213 start_codon:yes stop_codon:yes gene_type:complete